MAFVLLSVLFVSFLCGSLLGWGGGWLLRSLSVSAAASVPFPPPLKGEGREHRPQTEKKAGNCKNTRS